VIAPTELGELEAFRSILAGEPQLEVEGALCTCLEATPGSAMFNRALGVGLAQSATEAGLDEIDAFFSDRGLAYGIPLTPDAQPPELPAMLEARGFRRGYAWTKFSHPAERPPQQAEDLRVEELGADRADVFADVFSRAYGTPDVVRPKLERLPGSAPAGAVSPPSTAKSRRRPVRFSSPARSAGSGPQAPCRSAGGAARRTLSSPPGSRPASPSAAQRW
jgi:hypothetical protein